MVTNEFARAFCRECKCKVIPVKREVRVGHSVNNQFIDTNDTVLKDKCPLCESAKLNRLPDAELSWT